MHPETATKFDEQVWNVFLNEKRSTQKYIKENKNN